MKKIQVLDCTLRDGGYVNDWQFGKEAIEGVKKALEAAGVEIAELGFFRDEKHSPDRAIFDSAERLGGVIGNKSPNMIYTGLIEMANYFPPEKLSPCDKNGPEAIRYSFWKRLIGDAYDYCAVIKEKGYKLCCQPTRVEQYSDEEFAEMCRNFSKLKPYALYIVDTFGLLRKDDLLRYAKIGHENLDEGIILGYHAHDNMGQAFHNACSFLELPFDRTLQVDASIGGMGRGAGNLKLEMILEYLNVCHRKNYNLKPVLEAWDKYISPIKQRLSWGFDPAYFVAAANSCNPNYAGFYLEKGLMASQIEGIVSLIEGPDKYLYSDEKAEKFLKEGLK